MVISHRVTAKFRMIRNPRKTKKKYFQKFLWTHMMVKNSTWFFWNIFFEFRSILCQIIQIQQNWKTKQLTYTVNIIFFKNGYLKKTESSVFIQNNYCFINFFILYIQNSKRTQQIVCLLF